MTFGRTSYNYVLCSVGCRNWNQGKIHTYTLIWDLYLPQIQDSRKTFYSFFLTFLKYWSIGVEKCFQFFLEPKSLKMHFVSSYKRIANVPSCHILYITVASCWILKIYLEIRVELRISSSFCIRKNKLTLEFYREVMVISKTDKHTQTQVPLTNETGK